MASLPAETVQERKSPPPAVMTGSKIAAFVPTNLDEAWRLAGALSKSGMTPKSYGNDQNKIMVGIMAGAEVGLAPFSALQSIAVIGNNPSLWGDGALALIQASGLLEDMEETDDGHTATCRLVRVGRSSPIIRSFSMDDAKKAGLAGKAGPWTQYPARMRQMRARAFAMRDGFADVLRGLHIAEEARDYAPMNGGDLRSEIGATPLTGTMLIEQSKPEPAQSTAEALNDEIPALAGGAHDQATGEIIDANDGTLSPENPTAAEGPADEDRGEAHVEEAPAWAAKVQWMKDTIGKAKNGQQVKEVEGEYLRDAVMLPQEVADEIEELMRAKRAELSAAKAQGGENGQ